MRGIKIPLQDFALKMQGGLCARGAYLRDTTVIKFSLPMTFLAPPLLFFVGAREEPWNGATTKTLPIYNQFSSW